MGQLDGRVAVISGTGRGIGRAIALRYAAEGATIVVSAPAFLRTLTLNLTSAWWTSTAALPSMRDRGLGRIVNIGSGASKRAAASSSPRSSAAWQPCSPAPTVPASPAR